MFGGRPVCLASLLLFAFGCQAPATLVEGDHEAKYLRVFGGPPPADITIVNSAVVKYGWHTTDDWEFEIVVPRSWVETQISERHLRVATPQVVQPRKLEALEWYAPKPLDAYEIYTSYMTSIAYIHMLVDRERLPDARYRAFLSKH